MAENKKVKLLVSMGTFGELTTLMERNGRTLNDGKEITIESNDAVIPPIDFRLAALRQNCLAEVVKVYKTPIEKDFEVNNVDDFIRFFDKVFQYVFKGEMSTPAVEKSKSTW